MREPDDGEWRTLLRDALGTEPPGDLDGDLWPRMRERLARGPASPSPWDWALVAAMAGAIIAFPRIVIGILYHL